ncbi:MAG: class I SAM-dependent methyltransferase [Holophagales bacterium]|nr:class I SAM-dependent methyltransferase [Holophagales bacterium]
MSVDTEPLLDDITDTARWVARYRALETRRPDALFRDPLADRLAGARGRRIVDRMPGAGTAAPANIVRTYLIDHAVVALASGGGIDAVLNLGAGFDTRPHRLHLPPSLRWIEVDLPALIEEKAAVLADQRPRCRLERVSAELGDDSARRAIFDRFADGPPGRSLVITEGLLDYLSPARVACLARELADRPAFAGWLLDLLSPASLHHARALWEQQLTAADSTKRFAPSEGPEFFAPFGWQVLDLRSIEAECQRLRRSPSSASPWWMPWSGYAYFAAVVLLGRSGSPPATTPAGNVTEPPPQNA